MTHLAAELDDRDGLTTDHSGPTPELVTCLAGLAVAIATQEGSHPSDVLERAKSRAARLERMEHTKVRMGASD